MDTILRGLYQFDGDYAELQSRVKSTIKGRCCHHKVVILNMLQKIVPVQTYLEIGVHNGTSMAYVICQTRAPVFCVGVDLFEQTISRYTHDRLQQARTEANLQALNTSGSTIRLLRANSQLPHTVDRVKQELDGRTVDLLFIDADHSFEGIKRDFELYSPLLRAGGYLVLDDYCPDYPGILKCFKEVIEPRGDFEVLGIYDSNELILRKK